MGIPFDIDNVSRPVPKSEAIHELRQATPLSLKLWLHIEVSLASDNQLVQWLSCAWHLLMTGVMRYVHMQRSVIIAVSDSGIVARAALGKSKKSGARRPFRWAAPRFSLKGTDVGTLISTLIDQAFSTDETLPSFLLPDFLPLRVELGDCTDVGAKKMPIDRFIRLSKHLFMASPAEATEEEVEAVTSYSARRLFPSLGEMLGLPTEERVKLGGWGDHEAAELAKQGAMANRYAEFKVESSLVIKRILLEVVRTSVKARGPSVVSLDWANVFSKTVPLKSIRHYVHDGHDLGSRQEPTKVRPAPKLANSSSDDTESVTSSSSSSGSTSPANDVDEERVVFVQAGQGRGKLHLLDPEVDDTLPLGSVRCLCMRVLTAPTGGTGLAAAAARAPAARDQWSPRCFSKLHQRLQDRWTEMTENRLAE